MSEGHAGKASLPTGSASHSTGTLGPQEVPIPDIFVMTDEDGEAMLVAPVGPGLTKEGLGALWEGLEALRRNGYVMCTTCSAAIERDERGDVLDSSGRCDSCRP